MDALCRVGLVERVEVKPIDVVIQKIAALFGGPLHADFSNRLIVAVAAIKRLQQSCREDHARGKVSHPHEAI